MCFLLLTLALRLLFLHLLTCCVQEPRHVNLTANLDLSPFYPENAFPPRGLLADPNVDLKDPNNIPEKYQQQYKELVQYGAKCMFIFSFSSSFLTWKSDAHAIEDFAPVKSPEYVEESIRKGTPMVMEYTPGNSSFYFVNAYRNKKVIKAEIDSFLI